MKIWSTLFNFQIHNNDKQKKPFTRLYGPPLKDFMVSPPPDQLEIMIHNQIKSEKVLQIMLFFIKISIKKILKDFVSDYVRIYKNS